MATEQLHLLAAADAESGADGDGSQLAHAIQVVYDFRGHRDVLTRRARPGDRIHKALTAGT